MANDYNASINLSTTEAEKGVRSLDGAVGELDKKLASLDKTIRSTQGNLDTVTKSMSELTRANAALIRSETDRAKATVLSARADREAIINRGKLQKNVTDTAIAQAKAARIRAQTANADRSSRGTDTRRGSESEARIAAMNAVAQQRLASESIRTAVANENLAAATARAGAAQDRAANQAARFAAQQDRARNASLALNDSLSNSRYLLYDVGQTYTVLSAALLAIPTATAAVAIAYERDFAQVMRTNMDLEKSGGSFATLRQELKALATEIPLTFKEFGEITTIGGQLGIAGKDIGAFTETVAKFGAASNVTLEEASTAMGRFQQSFEVAQGKNTPDYFNKLGSAIAYVGVKSAASEKEIIAVSNQIAAAGSQFGFASEEIVGLSGALASVRIRPEMARGAFQRILLGLSGAADQGAQAFNQFGKYTGLAADESMKLFKSDPSQFFYKYIGGIKDAIAATGSVSTVMEDIGAKNVFDKQFILGLANGYEVFGQSLENASGAFEKGTFLNESTEGVFNTVDAQIQRITNSIKNLMDTIGKGSLKGLSGIADNLLNIIGAADRFAQATPGVTAFINAMMGLGTVVGVLLAFKAAQAFVLAGLVGFQQVLGKTSIAAGLTLKGNMQELAKTMLMAKGVTAAAATEFIKNTSVMKAMGASAALSAVQVRALNAGLGTAGIVASTASTRMGAAAMAVKGLSAALSFVGGPIGLAITALTLLGFAFISAGEEAKSAGDNIARSLANGAEAGVNAAAQELDKIKVKLTDTIAIGNLDKSFTEVARDAGVPFEKLAAAATKGADAGREVLKIMDEIAQSKGFKDFQDMKLNNPFGGDHVGQMEYLRKKVEEVGNASAGAAKNQKDVASASKEVGDAAAGTAPALEGMEDNLGGVASKAEEAKDKINEAIDALFGLTNAEMATQDALGKLGESSFESKSLSPGDAGGRENVSNLQDVLRNAALEQQALIDSGQQTMEQAAVNYTTFIDNLMAELVANGMDAEEVAYYANRVKGIFGQTLASGDQPTVQVKVDAGQVDEAKNYLDWVVAEYGTTNLDVILREGGSQQVADNVHNLQQYVLAATNEPYTVDVDSDSVAAYQGISDTVNWGYSILGTPFTATVDANADPFMQVMQFVQQYAAQVVNSVIDMINGVRGPVNALLGQQVDPIGHVGWGQVEAQAPKAAPAVPSTPRVTPPPNTGKSQKDDGGTRRANENTSALDGLKNAYNDAGEAAKEAGEKGKKAGEDAANGIDQATKAADDYANRLKQGLQAAYDKQYAMATAADAYYSALNAINKKREDELKQIQDLIAKQKELNNSRKEDLVGAKKAGIEKDISTKYGETDRAADYAQQEQSLLDSAAAKAKDIAVSKEQQLTIQAGIGKLTGYSQAAIDNRAALRDLESKMLDMISAYASTGASQEQVRAYAERLTGQFRKDAIQLGYNRTAVANLQGNLSRYIGVVRSVPMVKPTTVTANTGGANNAINGVKNNLNSIPRNVQSNVRVTTTKETISIFKGSIIPTGNRTANNQPTYRVIRPDGTPTNSLLFNKGGQIPGFAGGGQIPGRAPSDPRVDNLMAQVDGRGLVKVRSQEFIMQQPAVDYWGLPFMNAINNMKMPQFNSGGSVGGARGGMGSGDAMLVELTAEAIAAIQRMPPIILTTENRIIAQSANDGNAVLATQGAN